MKINGLLLPEYLVELVSQGKWQKPIDHTKLSLITGSKKAADFSLLSPESMESNTRQCYHLIDKGFGEIYRIASSSRSRQPINDDPGILDVDFGVLLAINWDEEVISLDYRRSVDMPCVIAMVEPFEKWNIIAPDFKSFADQIGL